MRECAGVTIRAAQYVRMSTDKQVYSTTNQKQEIARYAQQHGFDIVRTYADEGRSGLHLRGRYSLQKMLADVLSGEPGFNAILVYDVSRWGRFQDTDESAHYEFLCRQAGVPVLYCAEPFDNDDTMSTAIMKSLKRAMAGEFSRELSVKVFDGQARLARRGFKMGGGRRYGFDRMLVDEDGKQKDVLRPGQQKHLRTDHVILVPGPPDEVDTVRRMFRWCAWSGLSTRQIARRLNDEGKANINGLPWTGTGVAQILRSEIYTGTMIFGRFSKKLGARQVMNDPASWIRCEDAIEPLIDRRTFRAARRNMAGRQWSQSDEDLLEKLRSLGDRIGRLSVRDVLAQRGYPMPTTLARRFGSFRQACALAGHIRPTFPYTSLHPTLLFRACGLLEDAKGAIAATGGRVEDDSADRTLMVDGRYRLGVTMVRPVKPGAHSTWRIRLRDGFDVDGLLVALLNRTDNIVGYALLTETRFGASRDAYISECRPREANDRFGALSEVYHRIHG